MNIAFLRRRPKHYVRADEPVTLCGYRIPLRSRWRIRPSQRPFSWVTCEQCRDAAVNP